jgi:stringent starvation protein B
MVGYKPYLLDAFCRWCSAAGQTPVLEFEPMGCTLPGQAPDSPLRQKRVRLFLSDRYCRNLRISQEGVRFWMVPKGSSEPFEVSIPVANWVGIEANESGRLQPLDFEESKDSQTPTPPRSLLRLVAADGQLL